MGKIGFIFTAAMAIVVGTIINYSIASDSGQSGGSRSYIRSGSGYTGGGIGGTSGHK